MSKTKPKLTEDQQKNVDELLALKLVEGEKRAVYLCQDGCGRIQAHDYIPYGIGRGRWYGMCHCNAVSNEWIHRAALVGELDSERQQDEEKETEKPVLVQPTKAFGLYRPDGSLANFFNTERIQGEDQKKMMFSRAWEEVKPPSYHLAGVPVEQAYELAVAAGWSVLPVVTIPVSDSEKEAEASIIKFALDRYENFPWRSMGSAPKGGGAKRRDDPLWVPPPSILIEFEDGEFRICYWDWYYAKSGNGYCGLEAWVIAGTGDLAQKEHGKPVAWMPVPVRNSSSQIVESKTVEEIILEFAVAQWGVKSEERLVSKLAEETGEVAGATVKITEGRATADDLEQELGDVLIVLSQFAAKRGTTLEALRARRFKQIQARV